MLSLPPQGEDNQKLCVRTFLIPKFPDMPAGHLKQGIWFICSFCSSVKTGGMTLP